jgi:hypothetical protein
MSNHRGNHLSRKAQITKIHNLVRSQSEGFLSFLHKCEKDFFSDLGLGELDDVLRGRGKLRRRRGRRRLEDRALRNGGRVGNAAGIGGGYSGITGREVRRWHFSCLDNGRGRIITALASRRRKQQGDEKDSADGWEDKSLHNFLRQIEIGINR